MDDKLNTAYATVSRAKAIAEEVVKEQGGGTEVIANPELIGTESELIGLQVGQTKYKISEGFTPSLTVEIDAETGNAQLFDETTSEPINVEIEDYVFWNHCMINYDGITNKFVGTYLDAETGDRELVFGSIVPDLNEAGSLDIYTFILSKTGDYTYGIYSQTTHIPTSGS